MSRLRNKADRFYEIRDRIGASKATVFRLLRVHPFGLNYDIYLDYTSIIMPSPRIVNLEHRALKTPFGETTEANLMIKNVLQKDFHNEDQLRNQAYVPMETLITFGMEPSDWEAYSSIEYEPMWRIDSRNYETMSTEKKQLTWDIILKRNELREFRPIGDVILQGIPNFPGMDEAGISEDDFINFLNNLNVTRSNRLGE